MEKEEKEGLDYVERRRAQGRRTEQTILRSAMELSREKSFDKVSIRDICRRAGLTTGAFYHHFSSKNDLLSRGFAPLDTYMEEALEGHEGEPPLDRLWRILTAYACFMETQGAALVARYYEQRISNPSADSVDVGRFTFRAMLECLREMEEQGILAVEQGTVWAAEFLFRHFRGVVIDWVIHRGEYPLLPRLEQDCLFFTKILGTSGRPAL